MIGLGLVLQLFAASADGQAYVSQPRAIVHTATKAAVSVGVYQGLRAVGVARWPARLVGSVGVFVVSKAIERAKGHTLGPWDTVHDLAVHTVLLVPLRPGLGVGLLIVATCRQSSPRWC